MITFFAPTSFAIWMISRDVVPRTIESCDERKKIIHRSHGENGFDCRKTSPSTIRTFLSTNSSAIAFNFFRTLFFLEDVMELGVCPKPGREVTAQYAPHLLFWHYKSAPYIPILDEPFAIW